MREPTDEALMMAYANGDARAFESLYRRHRGPLYRFVLRQVGDPATANDLYQGSWEKIIRARDSYRPTAPFQAWMYRIARNHLIDHFRRSRPADELEPESIQGAEPGPEEALANHQADADLTAAVATLPAEQREALLLRLEGGLDLHSIAEITGVNAETAKSRLRYAVKKLRGALAGAEALS